VSVPDALHAEQDGDQRGEKAKSEKIAMEMSSCWSERLEIFAAGIVVTGIAVGMSGSPND
jgi:hypothetical protein